MHFHRGHQTAPRLVRDKATDQIATRLFINNGDRLRIGASPIDRGAARAVPDRRPLENLMTTLADAFALAQKHQRAREFRQAEQIYRKILQTSPENPQIWFCLGGLYRDQGKL